MIHASRRSYRKPKKNTSLYGIVEPAGDLKVNIIANRNKDMTTKKNNAVNAIHCIYLGIFNFLMVGKNKDLIHCAAIGNFIV